MRTPIVTLAACTLFCASLHADDGTSATPITDEATPDATLTLRGGSVAVGIGYTWGRGTLKYGADSHTFTIKGVSVMDVGASEVASLGNVYNLDELGNFPGTDVAAGAGLALALGRSAIYLKNEHGVVIKLSALDIGFRVKLSVDGIRVSLND